jgi:C4-dicarboxylate-specific signal transduction histidine kinase
VHTFLMQNPFEYLPENTVGRLIGIMLIILLGWQGRGFSLAFREDRRRDRAEEIDLLEEVRKITKDEMQELRAELQQERTRRRKLEKRVRLLERTLHENNIEAPDDV